MNADPASDGPAQGPCRRLMALIGICTTIFAVVIISGIGIASLLAQRGSNRTWTRWGDVGNTFGAINSVLSGLALAALVVTFWVQYQELREQRSELALQRESLRKAQTELYRTAEENLRKLHFDLIKMSIQDADLAAVWPSITPDIAHKQNRQHLYANLIYQHVLLSLRLSNHSEEQVQSSLRFLFSNRIMRDYWRSATLYRSTLAAGSHEFESALLADEICQEYDRVMAVSLTATPPRPRSSAALNRQWRNLDIRSQQPRRYSRSRLTRFQVPRQVTPPE